MIKEAMNRLLELKTPEILDIGGLPYSTGVVESLLKITGNIVHEASIVTNDNGFSQTVTAKTGIARTANVTAPSIIYLRPHRTFLEVAEQPQSMFVLRLREKITDENIRIVG